jgi:hypothetical protein
MCSGTVAFTKTTKIKNMKYVICLFLIGFCMSLSAEISILSPTGSTDATICNGSFTVRATGTAGPFTIQISATQNSDAITLEGVEGDFLIDGMCDGSYRVRVFPDGYLSCVKEMDVFLKGSGKAIGDVTYKENALLAKLVEGELLVEVTPNPADGPVMVNVSGLPSKKQTRGKGLSVQILKGDGQVLQRFAVAESRDGVTTSFPLDLGDFSGGVYLVRVVRGDEAEGTGRVVVR